MSETRAEVLVVGGGIAGIAAALELRAAGRAVLVLEAGSILGGKACNVSTPRGIFPGGPTSFNGRYAVFWRLLERLDLTGEALRLHPRARARFIVRDGRLAGIEPSPLKVLTTNALSLGDKWAFAKDALSRRRGAGTASDDGVDGDESLDAFLERRFGRATVDKFLSAVMTGIFAGDLTQLSAASCMPALVNAEREYGSVVWGLVKGLRTPPKDGATPGLFTFAAGMGRMAERAAERLDAHVDCTVRSVEVDGAGVRVEATRGGVAVAYRAERAVLATEAAPAASLLAPWAPDAAAVLAAFPYAPVTLVHWSEASEGDSRLPHGFGYLASPGERCFALGTLFVGDLLGEPRRRFSTFVGGAMEPARAALPEAELRAGLEGDLTRLTGGRVGAIDWVQRWPAGVFQPPVGHRARLRALEAALAGPAQGRVALAGSYFGGAALKDAVAAGFAAADALLRANAQAA